MIATRVLLEKKVHDMVLRYRLDENTRQVELNILPEGVPFGEEGEAWGDLTPLAFLKFQEDSPGAFGEGVSLRYSSGSYQLQFASQEVHDNSIETVMVHPNGVQLVHILDWREDIPVFRCRVRLVNNSARNQAVELLESFNIGGIGRELDHVDYGNMRLHRFRSQWCSEALHESRSAAEFQLERFRHVVRSERFGQAGALPVRGFHPFIAVEDPSRGVCWGAQIGWNGSWQLEFSTRNTLGLAMGGGLADFETGEWRKVFAPGEAFETPEAIFTCVKGSFDTLCDRLVLRIDAEVDYPACEEDLPVIFNEWCTSWGNPGMESVTRIADIIKTMPIQYLVIDAGWYRQGRDDWDRSQGDWLVNQRNFPGGIGEAVRKIRERGLIPGIWFEAEVVGNASDAYERDKAFLLKRDGEVITSGDRRFWDHNNPGARAILEERVVRFLKDNNFGYVKIDYNETPGTGCDHPDSPGEGLRCYCEGSLAFFRRLREVMPELVIENCASGGHRLVFEMMKRTSMSSVTDAHEDLSIPMIAASLHRLIPVRHNQIWMVLRKDADEKRLVYLITGAMFGRMCISGDIAELDEKQLQTVRRGVEMYRRMVPVLKDGFSVFHLQPGASRTAPNGIQAVSRCSRDGKQLILYIHAFEHAANETVIPLPEGNWQETERLQAENTGSLSVNGNTVTLKDPAAFSGHVICFEAK